VRAITWRSDLGGVRIVVTAGPTHEPIDPVRFIGNRSTGKMGVAVAAEAASRGADVRLILGPDTVSPPSSVSTVRVETADEMHRAVIAAANAGSVVVMAAAVADFRPKAVAEGKLKKESGAPELHLEPTPDILRELGERKGDRILVGFAAETSDLETAGRSKLRSKHLDMVVVNEVGREGTGFGSETNIAMILSADGDDEPLRTWTKTELAVAICDRIASLIARGRPRP
jgi:phosphopantothenoylcysteine decarboxylase/phosphopantothenate--cysteine ligase